MAKFKKDFEEQLRKKLSTRAGGSLIVKKSYLAQDPNQVFVYIGLGGLGGKMVNAMKYAAEQKPDIHAIRSISYPVVTR